MRRVVRLVPLDFRSKLNWLDVDRGLVETEKLLPLEPNKINQGIEYLPQTHKFESLYICNLMLRTFDISNLDYLLCQKHLRSTTLGCEDIAGLQKNQSMAYGAKTQFVSKVGGGRMISL